MIKMFVSVNFFKESTVNGFKITALKNLLCDNMKAKLAESNGKIQISF